MSILGLGIYRLHVADIDIKMEMDTNDWSEQTVDRFHMIPTQIPNLFAS